MDLSFLPAVNASLNAAVTLLLIAGFIFIRQNNRLAHRNCMVAAFSISVLFLLLYVTHKVWKATTGQGLHTTFNVQGPLKVLYLIILFTHLTLAMSVPVLAVRLIWLIRKKRELAHKKLAAIAWPIWLYVSTTGVLIYFVLYQWNPA